MGVVTEVGGDELRAILAYNHATGVNQHATRAPRTQRTVTKGVAKRGVGVTQTVLLTAIAREYHHVFVTHLTDGGSLEEVEVERILSFVQRLVLATCLVEQTTVGTAGRDERVDGLCTRAL